VVALPFALAVYVLMDFANALRLGWENPRAAAQSEWIRLVPAIALGVALGATLLVALPRRAGMIALGLFALAFGVYGLARRAETRWRVGTRWAWLAGLAGGVTGTLFGAGGPPYAIYLSHRGLAQEAFRATLAFATLTSIALRLAAFVAVGTLRDPAVWLCAAAVVPAGLGGLAVARRLYGRLRGDAARRAVAAVLVASGLSLLARAA